jgi:hypothetical protein
LRSQCSTAGSAIAARVSISARSGRAVKPICSATCISAFSVVPLSERLKRRRSTGMSVFRP